MQTRTLFILFLLCAQIPRANAQAVSYPANTYVWAGSGLELRKTPGLTGEIITTLPYGTAVEVMEYAEIIKGVNDWGDYEEPVEFRLKVYNEGSLEPTYLVSGSWVKAKANGETGYLFDAYLSGMQPYVPSAEQAGQLLTVAEGMKAMHDYWSETWEALQSTEKGTIFGDGTFFMVTRLFRFEEAKWVFPNISEREGYLLVNYFLALEKKSNIENAAEEFKHSWSKNPGDMAMLSFSYQTIANMTLDISFYGSTMIVISQWGGI